MTKLKGTYIKKNQKGGEINNIETKKTEEKNKNNEEEYKYNKYGMNLKHIQIVG